MQPPETDTPAEVVVAESAPGSARARLLSGLTWAAWYQVFELAVSFGAMLITVRLIPPGEYGRAAATLGVLTALNTVACGLFVSHALQLPDGEEPNWTHHLAAALYIQGGLFLACEAAACAAWFSAVYRSIAPLLHVAGIGLLFMAPNQVGITKLYRDLDFRRLKTISGLTTLAKLSTTIGLALTGHGALAIVCGNNVVSCMPFGIDLFLVRRWRPRAGWWRWPAWQEYRGPLQFGAQRIGAVLVGGVRSAVEAAVLPATLGFGIMGLIGRANGLYSTTAGRLESVIIDTIYPFLPRAAGDHDRYARRAMLFVQTALFVVVPAGFFIGLEGPSLSRLLYGRKWIAADPFILPATVTGVAITLSAVSANVLLGAGRLRRSLQVEATTAVLAALAAAGTMAGGAALRYLWMLAALNALAAAVGFGFAGSLLPRAWLSQSVLPAIASCTVGVGAIWAGHAGVPAQPFGHLAATGLLYVAGATVTARVAFAPVLVGLFDDLNWRRWPRRLLLLPVPAADVAPVS